MMIPRKGVLNFINFIDDIREELTISFFPVPPLSSLQVGIYHRMLHRMDLFRFVFELSLNLADPF